jgi:hypothetical protein
MQQKLDQAEENQKKDFEPVTLKFSTWLEHILQVMAYVILMHYLIFRQRITAAVVK